MSTPIDLSQITPPDVIEPLDYEALLSERKARLIELTPIDDRADLAATLALESEPLTKLLQENAYRELLLRERINDAARAVMLAYAAGGDLDQLGANFQVTRLMLDPGDSKAVPPVPPTYEHDRDFRARIQLAFEGLSVAGPVGAYQFHAAAAHPDVRDIAVESPAPVDVVLTVLSRQNEGIATPALLNIVRDYLEPYRPLTDRLTLQPAERTDYQVNATLTLRSGPDAELVTKEARGELSTYVDARYRLGGWVTRSGISAALTVQGVENVTLHGWQDLRSAPSQAPRCTGITLSTERLP
ncbi:baseplate assembly protein [Halomonas colorata]|uniref:baseplate assembly protein n=1 Tax=Halomonas colorata TaxID=2742615 RepID=UPI0018693590|nr:baseplate J/gp47 family protein [Halomonas colorata]